MGGLIGDSAEAWLFDEGLEQDRTVAVLKLPVVSDPVRGPSQDGRCEILALDPRQDQESGIVDHSMQALLALAGRPADEAVARLGFPGGGAEAEQGDDAPGGADEVAHPGTGAWKSSRCAASRPPTCTVYGILTFTPARGACSPRPASGSPPICSAPSMTAPDCAALRSGISTRPPRPSSTVCPKRSRNAPSHAP